MEIYRKSMREALEETRAYRNPKDVTEIVGGHGEMTIVHDDKGTMIIKTKDWQVYKAKGWQKKEHAEDYVGKDVSQKLSYDKWLKQVKGIEKGAYGITGDEHTKYSKEWKAYQKEELEEKLEVKWDKSKEGWYDKQGRRRYLGKGATMDLLKKQIDKAKATGDWSTFDLKKEEVEITEAVDVSSYTKQVAGRTARNDHFGARVILARMMKDKQLENFYTTLEKMHTTPQVSNAIGNDAITLRSKLEKVLKFRLKTRFGDTATNTLMGAL